MTVSMDQIVTNLISALRVSDPDLDTSVGTTTRKILDAVSEQIAEAYVDNQLTTYQYDIDSKVDADLDDFVQLFGMARLAAKRASGVVTFYRTASLTTAISIPMGTTVSTTDATPISVTTVANAMMEVGASSVSVPVQAVEAGTSSNVPANTLVTVSVNGITSATNMGALTGGTAQETDDQLRARWKATVFRNLAGTEQMYLGTALDDPDCYAANVVGASKELREQIQIVSGVGTTTVDDATFIFTEPIFVGNDIDAGDIFIPDVDYSWDTSVNPPRVVVLDSTSIPDGTIVEVDYEYEPISSRNDVANGIVNRVDIWCGGQRAVAAAQTVIFRQATRFTTVTGDRLNTTKFVADDGTHPASNNVFVPLAYGPIVSVPDTITVGGQVYGLATYDNPMGTSATVGSTTINYAYRVVHESVPNGFTATSMFGLEWSAASGFLPANNSVLTIAADDGYTYNSLISAIQTAVGNWRLLGVDAKVHAAQQVPLRLSLAIVYVRGAAIDTVNSTIDASVAALFSGVGFQGRIQMSDILQVVHNVTGVDNVRFLNASDYSGYNPATPQDYAVGVQQVIAESYDADTETYVPVIGTSYVDSTGRPKELRFGDHELPVLHSIVKVTKAANSFGVM